MAKIGKAELNSQGRANDPEKEQFKEARRAKWQNVYASIEAGDVDAARLLIAELQAEATLRYRRDNGEDV